MASISGPSSITINSLPATWTASGFSNPDQIDWSWSDGDGVGEGATLTLTSISNKNQTLTITAKQGSTSASKSVTVTKVTIPVTSFSVSPSSVSIYNGSYTTVSYSYSPSNATTGTLPSLSSGGKYCSATVSSKSIRITGTAVGSETLTFSNSDGVSFSVSVTVKSSGSSTTEVTSMTISPSSLTIQEGSTGSFKVTVSPASATNLSVTARVVSTATDYISIVSQTRNGAVTTITVKGLAPWSGANVLVTANGGSIPSQSASITVTKAPVYVTDFDLPDSPKYLKLNQNLSFKVTALPSNADDTSWTYSVISGSEYATVNRLSSPANYISVTPIAAGTVKIKITANDAGGYSETVTVIIDDDIPLTDIFVNYQGETTSSANISSITVAEGKYVDFYVVTRPTNAKDPSVSITNQGGSGDVTVSVLESYASLYKYRVMGVKQGTVSLLISANDSSGLTYPLTIYIQEKVNDDFPYDKLLYHTVYPFEETERSLMDNDYSIVGSRYLVHSGYTEGPLDLMGLYLPLDGGNFTELPPYESPLSTTMGLWLKGKHRFVIREFWIYITNANGNTVANKVSVKSRGNFVKTLRFNKNAPNGVTVTGTVPEPIVYDGTGDTVEYLFDIPRCNIEANGYVFVGWREYKDNTGCTVYQPGDEFPMKGGDMDVTLYAEWFPIPDKATGTGTTDDPFVWVVNATDLPLIVPNKGDYPIRYRGYFSDSVPDGMVFSANGEDLPTISNISLTSGQIEISGKPVYGFEGFRFVQIGTRAYQRDFNLTVITDPDDPSSPDIPVGKMVKVQFNPNGGTMDTTSVSTVVGRSILLPEADYEGMVLKGWYTEQANGNYMGSSGDRYVVTKSITLYAHWGLPPTENAECYLIASHDGITEKMYFEVVDSIEDVVTANLNSTSTVVFGASNRYVIDLGNNRKFNLNISRSNPVNYNDSSADQTRWSNGKWIRQFLNMIDFWQNFGRDYETGKNTGGFRFHFEPPPSVAELYPVIDKNVFIVGTVSPTYSGPQLVKMTIPLQVAGMDIRSGGTPTEYITYSGGRSGMVDVEQRFVKGAMVSIISMPSDWEEYQYSANLANWHGSDGKVYYPGDIVRIDSGTVLTAAWNFPEYTISETDDSTTIDFEGRVVIYAVGGGGSGASCRDYALLVGGGGGAGRTRIQTMQVTSGMKISWTIGAGGESVDPGSGDGGVSDGADGEDTVISINGIEAFRAEGGKGGKKPNEKPSGGPYSGMGGTGWGSGGTSNIPKWIENGQYIIDATVDVKGGDGESPAPNLDTNGGAGQYGGIVKNKLGLDAAFMGGSGGGASGLRVSFVGSIFQSRGGDGGYLMDSTDTITKPRAGYRGGGGGSGPYSNGAVGGNGIVIILKYRLK